MKKGLEDLKENFREQVEFWVVLKDWEAFRSHRENSALGRGTCFGRGQEVRSVQRVFKKLLS